MVVQVVRWDYIELESSVSNCPEAEIVLLTRVIR